MLDREPFLKAIAADPANDHHRMVFADFLDDRGEPDLAELIRIEREYLDTLSRSTVPRLVECLDRRGDLLAREAARTGTDVATVAAAVRGLYRPDDVAAVPVADLADPERLRRRACESHPHLYAATRLVVSAGRVTTPAELETVFTSPVTANVVRLGLSGREEHVGAGHDDRVGMRLIDYVLRPAITTGMVQHLCGMREARRLVALDLSRNDLDNDAVRALLRLTNLIRLAELAVQHGNGRVSGRLWGELRRKFDPGVVR